MPDDAKAHAPTGGNLELDHTPDAVRARLAAPASVSYLRDLIDELGFARDEGVS